MKLYLSPSNQPNNKYAYGNTSEKEQMELLAKLVQNKLSLFEVETKMADFGLYIYKSERPTEAKEANCDFYFAIHSNAGGKGVAKGPVAFYHPRSAISKTFADNLIKELNAITPHGENRYYQVNNGMEAFDGAGMGEVRYPFELGMGSLLLEVDFHDNPFTAKYIVNNKDSIADAIVKATAATFKLELKKSTPPKPTVPDNKDRINCDDYSDYNGIGTAKVVYGGRDGLNARRSPDFGNNIDHVVRKDEVFTVIRKVNKFYQLKSGLYLSDNPKFVEYRANPTFLVKITADKLNIRKGPSTDCPIVGSVSKGGVYTIVDTYGPWGKLKSGAGWIHLDYTEEN